MRASDGFKVAVVIPIHNGRDLTLRCLDQLGRSTVLPAQTIVVDDGSTDGSAAAIRFSFPAVEIITGDGNMWWSGAMNAGARRAFANGATHVYSLNNDCVIDTRSIEMTSARLSLMGPGLVCSKVRAWPEDGRLVSAGGTVNWWWRGLRLRGLGQMDSGQFDVPAAVDWMPGMGVLIPKVCFERVAGYDDRRFPHYQGDADFSMRVHRAGYSLCYEPDSVVWNDQVQTGIQVPDRPSLLDLHTLLTDRRSQYNLRETVSFVFRHSPAPALVTGLGSRYAFLFADLARRRLMSRTR